MTPTVLAPPPVEVSHVATLTDEELAVLDDTEPVAVRPRFDALSPEQQDVARQVAHRGLLAREIVEPPPPAALEAAFSAALDGAPGDRYPTARIDTLVRQDVQSVVALRRGAPTVVALARTTSVGHDFWYGYRTDDPPDVLLVEEVTETGLHRFGLAPGAALPDLVVAAAVHPATTDSVGVPTALPPEHRPATPPPIVAALGQALLRVDVVVRHHGRVATPVVGVFTGPAGSWLVAHGPDEPPVAHPMGAAELRAHLTTMIRAARPVAAGRHG